MTDGAGAGGVRDDDDEGTGDWVGDGDAAAVASVVADAVGKAVANVVASAVAVGPDVGTPATVSGRFSGGLPGWLSGGFTGGLGGGLADWAVGAGSAAPVGSVSTMVEDDAADSGDPEGLHAPRRDRTMTATTSPAEARQRWLG